MAWRPHSDESARACVVTNTARSIRFAVGSVVLLSPLPLPLPVPMQGMAAKKNPVGETRGCDPFAMLAALSFGGLKFRCRSGQVRQVVWMIVDGMGAFTGREAAVENGWN